MEHTMHAGSFLLLFALFIGQQPAKPPDLPPINPAQARLEQTLGGLDGPGFAVAADEESGMLAVGCERGAIAYWDKDVALGVRGGGNAVQALSGHQGPVLALAWRGGVLASAGADQKVILWNVGGRRPEQNQTACATRKRLSG